MAINKKPFETIRLDDKNSAVVILDQTLLPARVEYIHLTTLKSVWDAIYKLQVRGAPAIGIAAAMGMYIYMKEVASKVETKEDFLAEFYKAANYLSSARPTAVNLNWALKQMSTVLDANKSKNMPEIITKLKQAAQNIWEEDAKVCRTIGKHGATLLKPNMGVLTHCNAGALAASEYGTALAPIYTANENGINVNVFADETRPVLQGARLTAFELNTAGINTTLICDNMAAVVMSKGLVDIVFVGCDRVAANGDTANKIGTMSVAILAKNFGIPFYVCAPFSTIDTATKTGADIVIEERDGSEITELWYSQRLAPAGIKTFNPSFDVTPAEYITGFITEKGIVLPPFDKC